MFVQCADMPARPRLSSHELEILRRSARASGGLPLDQLEWLLGETRRLLEERREMRALLAQLRTPWPHLRRVLNELRAVLTEGEPADAAGGATGAAPEPSP